jgi:hypothetical protein
MTETPTACIRCKAKPNNGLCCSSHNAALCHECYRWTHFVMVCGCVHCTSEDLPKILEYPGVGRG